jgi:phospholipase/lecithinase/hemolysin
VKPVCATSDTYFYWDEWHPTRKVHGLVGEAMARALMTGE